MNNKRLANLEEFLKSEPEDPFNWYAVAMEYKSIDSNKFIEHIKHLLTHFPDYLATYYQSAEYLIEHSRNNEAEKVLEKGIELAKNKKDSNTLHELQNLLKNLLFEDE